MATVKVPNANDRFRVNLNGVPFGHARYWSEATALYEEAKQRFGTVELLCNGNRVLWCNALVRPRKRELA